MENHQSTKQPPSSSNPKELREEKRWVEYTLNSLAVFAIAYTLFWVVWGNMDANETKAQTYYFDAQ